MLHRRQEVIFEAEVEYVQGRIDKNVETRHIEDLVVRTLTMDLPGDLDRLFGLKVDINIKGIRYGSLSVFFAVVLTGYAVLSGYKGIFDSIELIRKQAEALLEAALGRFGRQEFSVRVHNRVPGLYRGHFEGSPPEAGGLALRQGSPRDGFFYFLLALCVVQFIAIGVLVYAAVVKTYFS